MSSPWTIDKLDTWPLPWHATSWGMSPPHCLHYLKAHLLLPEYHCAFYRYSNVNSTPSNVVSALNTFMVNHKVCQFLMALWHMLSKWNPWGVRMLVYKCGSILTPHIHQYHMPFVTSADPVKIWRECSKERLLHDSGFIANTASYLTFWLSWKVSAFCVWTHTKRFSGFIVPELHMYPVYKQVH